MPTRCTAAGWQDAFAGQCQRTAQLTMPTVLAVHACTRCPAACSFCNTVVGAHNKQEMMR